MFRFLTSHEKLERSFLLVARFAAVIGGFWPDENRTWLTVLLFWLTASLLGIGGFGSAAYGIVHIDDLSKALVAFCPASTQLISLLKMVIIFAYNRQFASIVWRLRNMVLLTADTVAKRQIMQSLMATANKYSFALSLWGSTTVLFFNSLPAVTMLYRYVTGSEVQKLLPLDIPNIPKVLLDYPIYPLTYITLAYSVLTTVIAFGGSDGLFVSACMAMSGVFNMLQHDICQLFADLKPCDFATEAQNHRIRHALKALVERHNAIIDLCSYFSQQFSVIVLWHFVSAALVLCCSILELMLKSTSLDGMLYFSYTLATLTQLYVYCIGSNYVSESSLAIADVLYDVDWYKCDTKTRKMILIMLTRAQRSTKIVAPFFAPSLVAFKSIINSTGSYIALLKTFI